MAKQSMFKCLTPLASNKSESTEILILHYWSLNKFEPFAIENQIYSGCNIFDEYGVRAGRF